MSLSEAARVEIAESLAAAPYGTRKQMVALLALRFGVSSSTIYRIVKLGGTPRPREGNADYRRWVKTAVVLSHRAPTPVPLDLAIEAGIAGGSLPPAAAKMPTGTAYRLRRNMDLRPIPRRTQRLHADYPMQALQFDGSTSKRLIAVKPLAEGDWLLRLHHAPTPASGYKNKPLPAHRMKPLTCGIWDMCTGYTRARYAVGRGENSLGSLEALCAMLAPSGDPERPLHGVPDNLWTDLGALFKGQIARELLERLNMALATGAAYHKERMGGVEHAWATLWRRFEDSLFLTEREEFTLSEINARLAKYEAKTVNERLSRIRVGEQLATRAAAWVALTNGRPADNPLRAFPANALDTAYRQATRHIDRNGILRFKGVEYESPRWHSEAVIVREALTGDEAVLTLEHPGTGERCEARPYQPRPYGMVNAMPSSALDTLLEAAAENPPASGDPYGTTGSDRRDGAIPMKARSAEAAPLANPLDTACYPSLEAAMADFARLCPWPLSAANRERIGAVITENHLHKQAVTELAAALLASLDSEGGTL